MADAIDKVVSAGALANSLDAALGALDAMAFEENTTLAGTVKEAVTLGMKAVAVLRALPSAIRPNVQAVKLATDYLALKRTLVSGEEITAVMREIVRLAGNEYVVSNSPK